MDIDGSVSLQHSVCKHNTRAFTITQIVFLGGLILIGCVLAFKSRNLGSTLGEAKQLLFALYNVALVALIVILLGNFLFSVDQKSLYVVMAVGVFWATVFGSCAFTIPRLLQVRENHQEQLRRKSSTMLMLSGRPSSYGISPSRDSHRFTESNDGQGGKNSFSNRRRSSADVCHFANSPEDPEESEHSENNTDQHESNQ